MVCRNLISTLGLALALSAGTATAQEVGFREEVMPGILKDNAARVLGLA